MFDHLFDYTTTYTAYSFKMLDDHLLTYLEGFGYSQCDSRGQLRSAYRH
jgi:hypothetical protein